MPLPGLGRLVSLPADQVSPPSVDHDSTIAPMPRERFSARMWPLLVTNSVGWMTPCGLPGTAMGPWRVQLLPSSVERSTHEHQVRWLSTDDGARMVPFTSIG